LKKCKRLIQSQRQSSRFLPRLSRRQRPYWPKPSRALLLSLNDWTPQPPNARLCSELAHPNLLES